MVLSMSPNSPLHSDSSVCSFYFFLLDRPHYPVISPNHLLLPIPHLPILWPKALSLSNGNLFFPPELKNSSSLGGDREERPYLGHTSLLPAVKSEPAYPDHSAPQDAFTPYTAFQQQHHHQLGFGFPGGSSSDHYHHHHHHHNPVHKLMATS